ncbi:hypothetical protein Mapa_011355 [Marchantia paleacea]|nr:hypothetical protein Mapa_011355 [Marchantia paleacea]
MADTVHFHLERMLPELDDLEKRGLFNQQEIKEIVKKRRDFEYLLKRPSPIKQDFLNYVEFEQNLEALRKLRKNALVRDLKGSEKWRNSLSDYASVMHIMLIYDRALTKFKGDLSMWLQYLEFCRSHAPRKMQKVTSKCLQLHPNVPGLWMYVAAWEFEQNLNVTAARVLMQRGLRMCPRSEKLWIEYFRMELTYLLKLKARKLVLGLDTENSLKPKLTKKSQNESDMTLRDVGEVSEDEEFKSEVENEGDDEAVSLEDQLSLKLSGAIFKNAVAAVPSSLDFRQRFLEVLDNFEFEQKEELEDKIYASIALDFPRNEDSWDWLARRYIVGQKVGYHYSLMEGKRRALEVYEDGLQAIPSAHMFELYARFLLDILDMDSTDLDSSTSPDSSIRNKTYRHDIADELIELYERALVAGFVSEALVKGHLEILLRSGMVHEAAELGRNFCERLDTRKFASLWEWRISLELGQMSLSTSNVDSMLAISKLLQQALTCVPLSDARRLYLMAMEFYTGQENLVISLLESAMAGGSGGQIGSGLACTLVDWILHSQGIKQARRVYKRFLALPGPSVELFKHCISMEGRSLGSSGATQELQIIRKLFNEAVELYGENDTQLWTMYYFEEIKAGHVNAAKNVYWRAKKALKDPTAFVERHQML